MSYQRIAHIYSASRPPYPEELFSTIRKRLHPTCRTTYVDLGCGTGELLLPLSNHFKICHGVDPELDMIEEAKLKLTPGSAIRFFHGTAESFLKSLDDSTKIDLVTAGRSFHWMDQAFIVRKLHDCLSNRGLFISLGENDGGIWNRTVDWAEKIKFVIEHKFPQKQTFIPTKGRKIDSESTKTQLAKLGNLSEYQFTAELFWTSDQIINLYLSTAGFREWLGTDLTDFIRYAKEALAAQERGNRFHLTSSIGMTIVGREQ